MGAQATLNIRLPEDLKERGMQVLNREGVSVSDVVRGLFRELESSQALPGFYERQAEASNRTEAERKRAQLRLLAQGARRAGEGGGSGEPAQTARAEYHSHLERKHAPGVRL